MGFLFGVLETAAALVFFLGFGMTSDPHSRRDGYKMMRNAALAAILFALMYR